MEFPGSSAEMPAMTQQRDEQHISTGNLQCLFYATSNSGALGEVTESIVRSNRVANAWIASLRSHQSPLMSTGNLPNVRYYHDPELFGATINSRNAAKRRESIELNHHHLLYHELSQNSEANRRRMRQLALQTSNKMRSLAARESSATAERWRYIQSALERRKRDSIDNRQRFIRQPLETVFESGARKSILKRSASAPDRPASAYWTRQWITNTRKNVRFKFDEHEDAGDQDFPAMCEDLDEIRYKLPALQILDEMPEANRAPEASSSSSKLMAIDDERLPPLESFVNGSSSWAERQVAKVRQRRLWSRLKTELGQQQEHQPKKRPLLRSESLLVNLSSGSEDDGQPEADVHHQDRPRSVTWSIDVERNKDLPGDEISKTDTDEERRVYSGWDRFPRQTATRILERLEISKKQKRPKEGDVESASSLLARRRQFSDKMRRRLAEVRRKRRPTATPGAAQHHRQQTMAESNEIPDMEDGGTAEVEKFSRLRKISEKSEVDDDDEAKLLEAETCLHSTEETVANEKMSATDELSMSECTIEKPEEELLPENIMPPTDEVFLTEVISKTDEMLDECENKSLMEDEKEDPVEEICADTSEECCASMERTPSSASTCSPSTSGQQMMDKRTKDAWNSLKMSDSTRPSSSGVASFVTNPSCEDYMTKLTMTADTLDPEQHQQARMTNDETQDDEAVEVEHSCRCIHKAVLSCLLPEAAGSLESLESIRRQLKRTRLMRDNRKPAEPLRPMHNS